MCIALSLYDRGRFSAASASSLVIGPSVNPFFSALKSPKKLWEAERCFLLAVDQIRSPEGAHNTFAQ